MNSAIRTLNIDALAVDVGFFSTKFSLGCAQAPTPVIQVDQFPSQAARVNGGLHNLPFSERPDGALIDVDGVNYFVGKSVFNMVNTHGSRAVTADYSKGATYKALFRGALYYVARHFGATSQLVIKRLVVGLPVSTIYTHANELRAMVEGDHVVPAPDGHGKIVVSVKVALVIAQPQGALVNAGLKRFDPNGRENVLVLDMGGGTFDWFVCQGMLPNHPRCGAAPIGMLACATAVCDNINPELKNDPQIIARVDAALRTEQPTVRITGRNEELAPHLPAVTAVLNDAVQQMLKSVGSMHNIDTILVTGGGAGLLVKEVKRSLPAYAHMVRVDADPVTSNVRGFHIIAELLNGEAR